MCVMKKVILLQLPLVFIAGACSRDEIETTDTVDSRVSNTCADLNKDIALLQTLASKAGVKYTNLTDGTLTFADNAAVTVAVSAYSSGYVNPTVGVSSAGEWTLEGKAVGAAAKSELLKLKIEKDVWKAYYGGSWTVLDLSLKAGDGVPVFAALPVEADGVVTVALSSGDKLTFEKYKGTETLSVSPSSVKFTADGGTATVTVTSNTSWTAASDASWVDFSPKSGSAGETVVTLSADANAASALGAALTLTTASGERSASVAVTQQGAAAAGNIILDSDDSVDTEDEDVVSNTVFDRRISIVWSSSGASVSGDDNGIVSVSGGAVTVSNTTTERIVYNLSGSSSNGSLKIYSSRKQALEMDGVSLTNPSGAAINIQSGKRTFVVVGGTNKLADGASYTLTPSDEDEKAAFFSEGELIFSGSGSLTVTATGKAGITSDDYVRFLSSPTVKVSSSAGHAVRGKDKVHVSNGTIEAVCSAAMKKGFSSDSLVRFDGGVTTIKITGGSGKDDDGDYTGSAGVKADKLFEMTAGTVTITNSGSGGKGIKVGSSSDMITLLPSVISGGSLTITTTGSKYTTGDISPKGIMVGWAVKKGEWAYSSWSGDLKITGGKVWVSATSAEAIEAKGALTITGGDVYAYAGNDDAINSVGDFTISGGSVCGISAGDDGLDANGNFYVKGGFVFAVAGQGGMSIDACSENSKKLYLSGGTLLALGSLENGFSASGVSAYSASVSATAGTWYGLTVGSSSYAVKMPSTLNASGMYVVGASTPTLWKSPSYSGGTAIFGDSGYALCTLGGGSSVTLSAYSGGGSGPGGGGGRPGW